MVITRDEVADIVRVSVNPGWAKVITREIYRLIDLGVELDGVDMKEKFGGLRINIYTRELTKGHSHPYITKLQDFIGDWRDDLEEKCSHLCEFCGAYGVIRYDLGWYRCCCNEHYQELLKGAEWRQIAERYKPK